MEQSVTGEFPQLGRLLSEHPATYRRLIMTAIGWGIPILAFLGFLLWDCFGPNANRIDPNTLTLLVGGAVLIWLFFTGMAAWETGPTVRVYEHGLVFGREPFCWDHIDAFFQEKYSLNSKGIQFRTSHDYTVRRADGKKAKFYLGIERADELAATIEQRINPRLLDAARRQLADGKSVDFGCAQLNKHSMRYQPVEGPNGELNWTEFRDMQVSGTEVTFRRQGAWFGFKLVTRKIANLTVMLALIDELVAASQSKPVRGEAGE